MCTRAAEIVQTLLEMKFDQNACGWRMEPGGKAALRNNVLNIDASGTSAIISQFVDQIGGEFTLRVEIQTFSESSLTLYWTSKGSPRRDETNKAAHRLSDDGDWHTYDFIFNVQDYLSGMALKFVTSNTADANGQRGTWAIRSMKLLRKSPPPLQISRYKSSQPETHGTKMYLRFTVQNHAAVPIQYTIDRQPEKLMLNKGESVDLDVPLKIAGQLVYAALTLHPQGFPDITRSVFLYDEHRDIALLRLTIAEDKILEAAPDGTMARLLYKNKPVGIIAPLVHRNGIIPKLTLKTNTADTLQFTGDDTDLQLKTENGKLKVVFSHNENPDISPPYEVFCVRLFGDIRSGLLPGVEMFGKGDVSSSEIDIAPPFNDRSYPEPAWLTQNFAVLETDKAGVVLKWDGKARVTFNSPNRYDETADHRLSLIGNNVEAGLELLMPTSEETGSAVFRELKVSSFRFQVPNESNHTKREARSFQLALQALAGRLQTDTGGKWGYGTKGDWQRQPFADFLSTLIRLNESGKLDDLTFLSFPKDIVPGGTDITNDTVYFVTGRVADWQRGRETAINQILETQQDDGAFLYRTRFPEVESGSSSFGYTALQALKIMEYVRGTGNAKGYAAVKKALDFLAKCDKPCGGYYADTPFHTPDLQTAAVLIWLYVWVYEYEDMRSDAEHYLERAKRFACLGLPFIYQSSYLAVAKFGGTNRGKPFAFGIADTRSGLLYAYALNMLSRCCTEDHWKALAWNILTATEKLQFTDGEEAGCLPQQYDIAAQKPCGYAVNPCALVSLRLALEGKIEALCVFVAGKDRYLSPYPLRKGKEGIEAFDVPNNRNFQVLLNGSRIGHGSGSGKITVD